MGRPARRAVRELVPSLKNEERIDLAIANAENAAGGMGVDVKSAGELFAAGVHVLTSGNHIWKKKEIFSYLDTQPNLIRPANYPEGAPGRGWCEWRNSSGLSALVINIQGRVFMPSHVDDPFRCADAILREHSRHSPIVIVDMHAEATSEKNAMGWYLDGRASAVVGTHTHVPTADTRILPGGTAYVTDVGMVGPSRSVIGVEIDAVIARFLTQMPHALPVAQDGSVQFNSVLVELDKTTGMPKSIQRVDREWE